MPPALTAVFTRRPRASVSLCRLPSPPALIWSSFSCCFSLFGLWDFRCGRPQLHRRNAARKSITLYANLPAGKLDSVWAQTATQAGVRQSRALISYTRGGGSLSPLTKPNLSNTHRQ